MHPLHVIIDRNQQFIFLFIETISCSQTRTKDYLEERLSSIIEKSKNGKILHVGCNITVTIRLITAKKFCHF